MNSVKVLHCADVHIGAAESFLGENAEKRRYETLLTFENIISAAKNEQVDFLLLAGDIFDSFNIDSNLISRVFESFLSIPEINIIYVAGNHDPLNSSSPFAAENLPSNLYVLGSDDSFIDFPDKNTRIYGRSFTDNSMQGKARFTITPPKDDIVNIMVLHGELKSDLNSSYNAITPDFVRYSKMDYIALGHIHKRSNILKLDSTYFAYCGCPEGQGFDELDDKGVYIGEISKGSCNLEFKAISMRRHICIDSDISDVRKSSEIYTKILEILKEEYGENYSRNLYKILLKGEVAEDFDIPLAELESRLNNEVYFAKFKDKTAIKIDTEELANEKSLKGIFTRNMLLKIKNAQTEEEKEILNEALQLGLKAFRSEVSYNED